MMVTAVTESILLFQTACQRVSPRAIRDPFHHCHQKNDFKLACLKRQILDLISRKSVLQFLEEELHEAEGSQNASVSHLMPLRKLNLESSGLLIQL